MASDSQEVHRPGSLKQQNKGHKHGKHKSKGQLERDNKGRVDVKVLSRKNQTVKRKNDRRYQAQQVRKNKREEVLAKKRSVGSSGTPPHLVVVVPLHSSTSTASVIDTLSTCDDTTTSTSTECGITHLSIPRFKQRVELLPTEYGNLYETLDAAKLADSVLLLVSPEEGLDTFGDHCLSCLFGQGFPAVTIVVQGLKGVANKKQKDTRKQLQKLLEKWFPDDKVHSVDSAQEGLLVLRHITSQRLKPVYYRENRSHLLAENVQFEINEDSDSRGTLKLTGYVRSQTLSVNGLVHLPGQGEFQLAQIDVLEDPYPLHQRSDRRKQAQAEDTEMGVDDMVADVITTERPNPARQETLDSEVIPDPMEGEQTWPTEEELAEAEERQAKVVRRVPKGTSEYQSSWIVDEPGQEVEDGEDDDIDDMDEDMEAEDGEDSDEALSESDHEEYENVTVSGDPEDADAAKYDEQMDMEEEQMMLEKIKKEKLHVMFPDEVDTPRDTTARGRFQRYRGLKSYRTSPWDTKENLPLDYARIFQFGNFKRTARKVLAGDDDMEGGVPAWSYVRVHVAEVPKSFMDERKPSSPVVLFAVLPHEQKMSVINLVLRKCADVTRPIQSKERLVFHVGFRRFSACPIFSQHTNGNKHKAERFLPQDSITVATMYAPITFPPAPVLVFQDRPFGGLELVARGSLMSVDPDRIIAKRAVISGYPFKINKKSCVVRYMFFNREDINWFKPVELRTKWGRRGHIKDALGTHGHMKCIFDGHLKSQDTVMMNLYKRVFPKWTYSPIVHSPAVVRASKPAVTMDTIEEGDMDDEEEGAAYAMFD